MCVDDMEMFLSRQESPELLTERTRTEKGGRVKSSLHTC